MSPGLPDLMNIAVRVASHAQQGRLGPMVMRRRYRSTPHLKLAASSGSPLPSHVEAAG